MIAADDRRIQYTGRIDFSDPKKPRFWAPGVYLTARFRGTYCDIVVNDEVLWGNSHNYIEIAIDDKKPFRIQTKEKINTVRVADGLANGPHTITVTKDTEAGIGYLEFVGFRCAGLLAPPKLPRHKLEFIGDSISSGTGSDTSEKPCNTGQWYDQHNAYMSYGATTARLLGAQAHLSAVAGIGLTHSCCNMKVVMPQVFDRINFQDNGPKWDLRKYQPDAVTVCLGQNDGQIDPTAFADAYIAFIKQLRSDYPRAQIVLLNSPMGDSGLVAYQKLNLTKVVERAKREGDPRVHAFFFSQSFNGGCGGHPNVEQHQQIAGELSAYLKQLLKW